MRRNALALTGLTGLLVLLGLTLATLVVVVADRGGDAKHSPAAVVADLAAADRAIAEPLHDDPAPTASADTEAEPDAPLALAAAPIGAEDLAELVAAIWELLAWMAGEGLGEFAGWMPDEEDWIDEPWTDADASDADAPVVVHRDDASAIDEPPIEPGGGDVATQQVLAPIVDVQLRVAESYPPQYFVDIVAGQPDGCHEFAGVAEEREGTAITITVWNSAPADLSAYACAMIWSERGDGRGAGERFRAGGNLHHPRQRLRAADLRGRVAPGEAGAPRWQAQRGAANWKLIVENGMESYHLFKVHEKTLEKVTPTRGAYYIEGSAAWTLTGGAIVQGGGQSRHGRDLPRGADLPEGESLALLDHRDAVDRPQRGAHRLRSGAVGRLAAAGPSRPARRRRGGAPRSCGGCEGASPINAHPRALVGDYLQ